MTNEQLLNQWHKGICIGQVAHLRYAAQCHTYHRFFGIPTIILTTVAGTSLFTVPKADLNAGVVTTAAIVSLVAAALSAVQTFLNFSELAIKHGEYGKKYGRLRKYVETVIASEPEEEEMVEYLKEIREQWSALEDEAPTIPQGHYDRAQAYVSGKQRALES